MRRDDAMSLLLPVRLLRRNSVGPTTGICWICRGVSMGQTNTLQLRFDAFELLFE
jgi:hypothetical protein